ncbi:acyltransferase family protein [Paenarthrobacter nicotinovorans]|uniref:acyltransferase family protein n=1 Tax=Paenarthrobacter nicotinovorans TaxID=29320 RepID=UPI0011A99605|nr:acyltransferase family protein [Paenarthrobacter nicotinovorans]
MTQTAHKVLPAQRKSKTTTTFRPDVQGLRALAVLAVVADHMLGYPVGGFVGVDIFFVISGFLITGLLLREHESRGSISFADFYRRRVRRIVPVAIIVLATTVACSWLVFSRGRAQDVTEDALWSLVFGTNWHLAAIGTDYMHAGGPVSPLQHFWSLAVEEQFYVVWPWVIVIVLGFIVERMRLRPNRARFVLGTVVAAIIGTTFAFSIWESSANPTVAYFSTASRAWELGIGSLLAIAAPVIANLSLRIRLILGYAGLAGLAWSLLFITSSMPFPGPWASVPVLATALVIISGTGGQHRLMYPLTNPVSRYVGDISYSLYLWHFPVIIVLSALLPKTDFLDWALMLLLMLALSVASYHFIEDPIRRSAWLEPRRRASKPRLADLFDQKSVYAAVGVLALVTALVVTLAWFRPPAVDSFDFQSTNTAQSGPAAAGKDASPPSSPLEKLQAELAAANVAQAWPVLVPSIDELDGKFVPEWVEDKCLNVSEDNIHNCLYGEPSAPRTAVLLGDSVSISWMPGLRESIGKQGWKIQSLTMGQCPAVEIPVTRSSNAEGFTEACLAHQRWAMSKIKEMNPDLIIVNSALNTTTRVVGATTNPNLVEEWTKATVSKLRELASAASGKIVLLSVAMQGENLLECATKVSRPAACNGTNKEYLKMLAAEEKAAATVPSVKFVSTEKWFCVAEKQCPAFAGTTPIFVDGSHITPAYSVKLAPVLGPAVLGED